MARFPRTCSVCDKTCASKEEWLGHLLQREHSDKAKEQCHSWGADIKQCSLVICGKYPLARKANLEYFSGGGGFVVDFVCDASRPLYGVIRFENGVMVEQLVKTMGSETKVDGDKIELRKANEMPATDWKAILPEPIAAVMSVTNADLPKTTKDGAQADVKVIRQKKKKSKKNRKKKKKGFQQATEEEQDVLKAPTPAAQPKYDKEVLVKMIEPGSAPNLVDQYAALRLEVEIPRQQVNRVFDLLDRIRAAIREHDPRTSVNYFRHQHLKLLNASSNKLLIYVSQLNLQPLNLDIEKILETISIKPLGAEYQEALEAGHQYIDEQDGLSFEIVTAGHYHAEVVTCQWADYLLKFDPRAKSLLTLIHFWARENSLTLAEERIAKKKQFDAIPDPAALEWLCIFYLCKNKIIPTPLEVLNGPTSEPKFVSSGRHWLLPFAPRKSDFIKFWKGNNQKDVPKWGSKAYVLDVLRLARDFFQFYTSSNFRGSVLKTQDAELISTKSAFTSGLMKRPRYDDEETMAQFQMNQEALMEEWERKIFLMQPLLPGGRFSICQKKFERVVQPLMRMTGNKLNFYLDNQQTQGKRIIELKSLFRSGDLQNECLQNDPVDFQKLEAVRHQDIITGLQCDCKSSGSICNENDFRCHFSTVLVKMLISDKEKKLIMAVEKGLQELFESMEFEDCQLILFRSCHLNFSHFGAESRVYFFLDHPGLYGERYGKRAILPVDAKERQEVIARIENKGESFKKLRELLLAPLDKGNRNRIRVVVGKDIGTEEELPTFHGFKLGLEFCLAPRSYFLEVQTNRLVEYLCTFDRRVKPVMVLIFYWVKMNGIQLGKGGPVKVGFAPDPALLEWLVLYFLHTKKVVPSPIEIFNLDPDEKLFFDMDNIGFTVDPQYAQNWSDLYDEENNDKIIFEVYLLACQFFDFWSELGELAKAKPMVIDLKYFRSFSKDKMDEAKDIFDFEVLTELTGVETFQLKLINSQRLIRESFHSRSEALTFLHPVHVKYGFSFCSETFVNCVCPKMGVVVKRLSCKLGTEQGSGDKEKQVVDVDSLFLI